jgi:hypothetical protein
LSDNKSWYIRNTAGSSMSGRDFAQLDAIEFEHLTTRLLRDMGFEAETTKASGDGGIDVEAVLNRPIVEGRISFNANASLPTIWSVARP